MLPAAQAAQFFERIEVPVAVQQRVVVLDTKSSDQYVDGTSYSNTLLAQAAVVLRRSKHSLGTADGLDAKRLHQQPRLTVIALMAEAAQHLEEHQVRHNQPDFAVGEQMVEQLG